ncbi:MAG: 2,4-dienoyl-CoA reductase [Myxococcaceae bacterium]|nr:2,4-dienoyl-CoA reductase [Myxococcaceae bacterium]
MSQLLRVVHPVPAEPWPTADEAAASLLFSPLPLGRGLTLASRTWVPAMVPWRATAEGEVTDAVLAWYARYADGRPGALVVEATGIRDVPSGPLLRISHDRYVDGLRRLVDTVRARSHGETRVFIQLIDFLAIRRRPEPASYFARFLRVDEGHRRRLADLLGRAAPAADDALRAALAALPDTALDAVLTARELDDLRRGYRERVTDLHLPHIRALPTALPPLFADAAARAEAAGFDGVELHYAHAYTMASFLSALNDRDDGYGRSRDGRVRLPREVFAAVRARVGGGFVVGCRLLGDEAIAGGSAVDDAAFFAAALAADGMDFVSVSKGGKFEDAKAPKVGEAAYPYTGPSGHECMPTVRSDARGPFGRNLPLSRAVRAAIRAAGLATPVVGAGGITGYRLAEAALARGDCDVVAAARQSLADPDWWRKVRLGRGAEVRRCKLTNYCEGLDQHHKQVTCQLWDRAVVEGEDAASVARSADGRRRLEAPRWEE